jgi:hypothetical protein
MDNKERLEQIINRATNEPEPRRRLRTITMAVLSEIQDRLEKDAGTDLDPPDDNFEFQPITPWEWNEISEKVADQVIGANLLAPEWINIKGECAPGEEYFGKYILVWPPSPGEGGEAQVRVMWPEDGRKARFRTHWQPMPDSPKDNHDD